MYKRQVEYAVKIANSTRPSRTKLDFIKRYVRWGAGPRASQFMVLGAKTRAVLHGNLTPSLEDVRAVAPPVLRHRIITSFNAEAEGVTTDDIIKMLLEEIRE